MEKGRVWSSSYLYIEIYGELNLWKKLSLWKKIN
jgi:hypothetical protein